MTGAEHYAEAERLLVSCQLAPSDGHDAATYPGLEGGIDATSHALAAAQVHATLALASATSILEPSVARPFGYPEPVIEDVWATPVPAALGGGGRAVIGYEVARAQMDGMVAALGPLVGLSDGEGMLMGRKFRVSVEWLEPVEPQHVQMAREYVAAARLRCDLTSTPVGGDQ